MTNVTHPGDGDSELAAPLDDGPPADGATSEPEDEAQTDAVRPRGAARPSNSIILLGAILVIVVAQLVVTMLVLVSTNQTRDQYTSANGLQRCLIRAQLNSSGAADYKVAVNNCLK